MSTEIKKIRRDLINMGYQIFMKILKSMVFSFCEVNFEN